MLLQASPHPIANDWQHRATANGGLTHNIHRDAASRLCKWLDSAGLTSQMIEVYAFLGDNILAICTKLFYSAIGSSGYISSLNFIAGNILDFGGLRDAGNASKYLNTNMTTAIALVGAESTAGAHWYTRNTAAAGTSQVFFFGTGGSPGNSITAGWVNTGSRESGLIASTGGAAVGTTTPSVGFQGVLNQKSRSTQYFLNGAAVGAVSPAGTGTWAVSNKLLMLSNSIGIFWKRDALYGDVTVGMTAADELRLSQSVRAFQQFLNRA